jgi:hypothetical protein
MTKLEAQYRISYLAKRSAFNHITVDEKSELSRLQDYILTFTMQPFNIVADDAFEDKMRLFVEETERVEKLLSTFPNIEDV